MTRATTCRTSPNYPTDEWTRRAPRAWHARGIRRSGERSEKGGCRATEVTDRRGVPVILEGGVGMNRFVRTLVAAVALLPLIVPAIGTADDDDRQLRTNLSGFNRLVAHSAPAPVPFSRPAAAASSSRSTSRIGRSTTSSSTSSPTPPPRQRAPSSSTRRISTSARSTPPAASTCGCASRRTIWRLST